MYKKGQKVYQVTGSTGRDAVAWIKEFEVASWGAKEGTLRRMDNGQMSKTVVYTSAYNPDGRCNLRGHFSGIYAADKYTREQIESIALLLATKARADRIEHLRECLTRDAGPGYHKSIQGDLDLLLASTPSVMWL